MIDLYSGTPGSGKSLHVASYIYWALRRGKPVICNFDIQTRKFKRCNFTYIENHLLDPADLIARSQRYFAHKRVVEDEILLVIDECQLLFNAREWSKKGRDDWLSFFTQHRKYGFHIILIAQFDMMIDKQIRSLIEYEYVHRKVSNFGWKGWLLSLFLGGKTFVAVKVWYPLKQKVGSEFFHAHKRYYSLYDTYGQFNKAEPPAGAR